MGRRVRGERDDVIERLVRQFPDVPGDVVASIFGDVFQVVVECTGLPLVGKAEEFARLRLEVRTRHPALDWPEDHVG